MLDSEYNLKLLNFGFAQGSDLVEEVYSYEDETSTLGGPQRRELDEGVTEDLRAVGYILFNLMTQNSPPSDRSAATFWENVTTDDLSPNFIDIIEIML